MPHHVRVQPVRLRGLDPELRCEVTRVVAYRAGCSCGWRSKSVKTFRNARVLGRLHVVAT